MQNRRQVFLSFGILIVLSAISTAALSAPPRANPNALRADMRKLWEDHITWTRLYIVSATADLPNKKEATANRLLQNQTDIGDAVRRRVSTGTRPVTSWQLLKDHILIAVEIIDAAKKGDAAKKDAAVKRWSSQRG